jgi:hypothetical protein
LGSNSVVPEGRFAIVEQSFDRALGFSVDLIVKLGKHDIHPVVRMSA